MRFTDDGISAELSFGGYITRCHFPWISVYVVADRATGRGIVLDKHVPESVKRGREKQTTGPWTTKTDLRPVFDGAKKSEDAESPPAEAEAPSRVAAEAAPAPAKEPESVKKRRASFRVIDGGS